MTNPICRADGCERPTRRIGPKSVWCQLHHDRLRRYGRLDNLPKSEPKRCSVSECDHPARARGWCSMHYYRAKGNGGDPGPARNLHDLSEPRQPNAYGYRWVTRRDHPLANERGEVLEHRAVLYDAIGPGAHPCTWCGITLTWGVDLCVDHLDWDRLNNAASNLVPSCTPCNSQRTEQNSA